MNDQWPPQSVPELSEHFNSVKDKKAHEIKATSSNPIIIRDEINRLKNALKENLPAPVLVPPWDTTRQKIEKEKFNRSQKALRKLLKLEEKTKKLKEKIRDDFDQSSGRER